MARRVSCATGVSGQETRSALVIEQIDAQRRGQQNESLRRVTQNLNFVIIRSGEEFAGQPGVEVLDCAREILGRIEKREKAVLPVGLDHPEGAPLRVGHFQTTEKAEQILPKAAQNLAVGQGGGDMAANEARGLIQIEKRQAVLFAHLDVTGKKALIEKELQKSQHRGGFLDRLQDDLVRIDIKNPVGLFKTGQAGTFGHQKFLLEENLRHSPPPFSKKLPLGLYALRLQRSSRGSWRAVLIHLGLIRVGETIVLCNLFPKRF